MKQRILRESLSPDAVALARASTFDGRRHPPAILSVAFSSYRYVHDAGATRSAAWR